MKKKIRELEKTLEFMKENDQKKCYQVLREFENIKTLLNKIQIRNTEMKLQMKGIKDNS